MASKELAVVSKGTNAVQYIDPAKVNYAVASRWLATQNTGGGNNMFAGRQLRFNGKKGGMTEYVNKKNKKIKDPTFVVNVPNCYAVWQYWPEGERPSYPAVIGIWDEAAVLPSRAQMGPPETKRNELSGKDEDVYNEGVVLILRNPETDDIYHWVGCKSQKNAMVEFLRDNAEEFARRKGKLPVVEVSSEETPGANNSTFEKPVFTIVEWVKPTAMDNPQGLAAALAAEAGNEDEDDDEPVKASVKSRSAKPTASKSKSRDDDDEDEDEDEEDDDAPTTKLAVKKRVAQQAAAKKKYADDDEDEDDEDEDDEPAPKSKAKGKAVVASKRKVAAVDDDEEEDEDEDDEPAPRRNGRRGR